MKPVSRSAQLLEILSDGEWHALDDLAALCCARIPPETLIRRGMRGGSRGKPPATTPISRLIWSGKRAILTTLLYTLRRDYQVATEYGGTPHSASYAVRIIKDTESA